QARHEMEDVPEELGPLAVRRHHRAQQEGEIDAGLSELGGGPEQRGENEGAGQPSDQRRPDAHAIACSNATAAPINDRCVSACGKLPRNAPSSGSISSEKSPTSLDRPTRSSISSAASDMRPAWMRASTSQNEQVRNAPSFPETPSSPRYR